MRHSHYQKFCIPDYKVFRWISAMIFPILLFLQFMSAFILLFIGVIIAVVLLLMEWCYFKYFRKFLGNCTTWIFCCNLLSIDLAESIKKTSIEWVILIFLFITMNLQWQPIFVSFQTKSSSKTNHIGKRKQVVYQSNLRPQHQVCDPRFTRSHSTNTFFAKSTRSTTL